MCPAQETYDQKVTFNSTYELSYWSWGLKLAQKWRERQKLARIPEWDRVIQHLSPLPVHDGLYIGAESQPDFWEINRKDHPSFLAAYGVLPGDMVDHETMRRTFHKTLDTWPWNGGWGWDCGMAAMTATRLREPEFAVECLLRDTGEEPFLGQRAQHQFSALLSARQWQSAGGSCHHDGRLGGWTKPCARLSRRMVSGR